MNLKPGCGCLVIVLAIVDALLCILAIMNLIAGRVDNPLNAILHALALGGSAFICVSIGIPAIRRRRVQQVDSADEEATAPTDEGADAED